MKITSEDIDRQKRFVEFLDQSELFTGGMPILAIDYPTREEVLKAEAEYAKKERRKR